jgi:hypothetical protein
MATTTEIIEHVRVKDPSWLASIEDYNSGGDPKFTVWLLRVDYHVKKVAGFGFLDLEDVDLAGMFEGEVTPREAARTVLTNSEVF